jgi:hypothetical protein
MTNAIEELDQEISREEYNLALVVDRIDAMWELRIAAERVAKTLDRPVTFDDLLPACETRRDRAKLLSLFARVTGGTGPSGLDEEEIGRHHSDSAEFAKRVGGEVLS